MKYSWIDTELLQKPGVTKDLQADWNWIRYHIGGKMFAAVCLDDATGKPVYITCKLDPAEGEFLRRQYEDIIPGYYTLTVYSRTNLGAPIINARVNFARNSTCLVSILGSYNSFRLQFIC